MREKLFSMQYSVSIIPEIGFRVLYQVIDVTGEILRAANEKSLLLRAARCSGPQCSLPVVSFPDS